MVVSPGQTRRSPLLPFDIVPSVCPHDCPSACVLEVERIKPTPAEAGGRRTRRVRGARRQAYTRGVVCAKVARYAELGPEHARLPGFPDHVAVIDEGDPDRPFRLVAAPSRSFLNTSFNNLPSSVAREGRPTALVHPEVLDELGLVDGDRVRIGNRHGSVVVHARAFDGLQKRVVIVEGLWPNHAFEEGIGINLLTSADPGLPRGGAVFHDTSVWLSPA